MADQSQDHYAGDLTLEESWAQLADDERAVLIDVRTEAEWSFVGVPALDEIGRPLRLVEWVRYPSGEANPDFLAQACDQLEPGQPLLVLCRSGARSQQAAIALTAAGFGPAYNVAPGFEGPLDGAGHRHGGWKDSLPWRQS
jgi:rhodanese-related sulfurtransferase